MYTVSIGWAKPVYPDGPNETTIPFNTLTAAMHAGLQYACMSSVQTVWVCEGPLVHSMYDRNDNPLRQQVGLEGVNGAYGSGPEMVQVDRK